MTNFVTSLIRTWTPIIVGAFVSWLLTLGIDVDADTQAALIISVTALLQGLYYLVVRLLEKKWPKIGVLLGSLKTPEYK